MNDLGDKIILKKVNKEDVQFLYELIKERIQYPKEFWTPPEEIPSFKQHQCFVKNFIEGNEYNNYDVWFTIYISEDKKMKKVGAIVLKKDGEWGYHILMKYWNRGIGPAAFKKLIELYPHKRLVCRIKVGNMRARHIVEEKLGHKLKELTYVREPDSK